MTAESKIEWELATAEAKAWDALARYKFWMFGYWAGVWVNLNRLLSVPRSNPFRLVVKLARKTRGEHGNPKLDRSAALWPETSGAIAGAPRCDNGETKK